MVPRAAVMSNPITASLIISRSLRSVAQHGPVGPWLPCRKRPALQCRCGGAEAKRYTTHVVEHAWRRQGNEEAL